MDITIWRPGEQEAESIRKFKGFIRFLFLWFIPFYLFYGSFYMTKSSLTKYLAFSVGAFWLLNSVMIGTNLGKRVRFSKNVWNLIKSIKKFITWFITFGVGFYLASTIIISLLWPILSLKSIILAGFIIESTSKIMQAYKFRKTWSLDKHYLFWIAIQSLAYYASLRIILLLKFETFNAFVTSNIDKYIFALLLPPLLITIIVNLVWKLRLETAIFGRR